MPKNWLTYLRHFVGLFFPNVCHACNAALVTHEDVLCTHCLQNLPYTLYEKQPINAVTKQLAGRLPLQLGFALVFFVKGGLVQQLMHRLKYQNSPQTGYKMGLLSGARLRQIPQFATVDVIIPVPLHPKKLKLRGYNQSLSFAQGISKQCGITVNTTALIRTRHTDTQTKKSRFGRYQNMQEVFTVATPTELKNKHILLVDDILTTGATIEACGLPLLHIEGVKLSVATIAYAE